MKMVDGWPRRARLDLATPAETAIRAASAAVEAAGADIRLTKAINLLWQARELVADFVDGVHSPTPSAYAPASPPPVYDQIFADGVKWLDEDA